MISKHAIFASILIAVIPLLLAACTGGADTTLLPTATFMPTQEMPTATATQLPPPTVTPYPTATPGLPDDDASGDDTEGEAPEEGTPETEDSTDEPATSVPTEEPTDTTSTSETFVLGDLFFSADFSLGWPAIEDDNATLQISGGAYVFQLENSAIRYVTTTGSIIGDFYAEVDIIPAECSAGAGYGLFFRAEDDDNYYSLTFFCDNRVTVYARDRGVLSREPLFELSLPAGLNAASSERHTIGVLAEDSSFTLYFDGERLGNFENGLHSEGDIALYALSQGGAGLQVAFDNLYIWNLP